ncbi:Angiomotin [Sergentomyia squamirostris]
MSSHPIGLRFSPFSSSAAGIGGFVVSGMQSGPLKKGRSLQKSNKATNTISSLSGSETDISTSTENLSMEERYVLRHTARVEPQGQENMLENVPVVASENARFSSNTSMDSSRYPPSNKSISETRNPIYVQQSAQQVVSQGPNGTGSGSNRNSLKETNSNRSSMDVSTCSYNTIIIHNDDSLYSLNGRDYPSPPPSSIFKKDRPRSYGEQGIQEITQIPDDYLNQSHVLKHLAKEIKIPVNRRSNTRDSGVSENTDPKEPPKYVNWTGNVEDQGNGVNKVKSKSQPDLTRRPADMDLETIEALMKENSLLKQQLNTCYTKVAKTQKLEEEVANIYRVHEELVQSCERREKLERAARTRLQSDLQRVQELNKALKDQVDIFQSQLLAPSEHQILIAQLFTQNKELTAAKDRQEIELAAQRATLQEQRNHIGILDTALTNTQQNMRRLEDELRKKQAYIERLTQLHQQTKAQHMNEQRRFMYENELSKDSNRSGSSTNSESKWQIQEKANQIRLESEQRQLEEAQLRQNVAKAMEKTAQETDRIIAEAKQEKMRYLEEVHSAQRRVNELQAHLKVLESRLAEKDAVLRVLQGPKVHVGSFDSYNLSTDSYAMSPLSYNSQGSFNVSNTSFHTTTNTSLLDPSPYGANSSSNFSPTPSISATYGASPATVTTTPYGSQTPTPTYNHQSSMNLQSMGNYSPNSSSNYSAGNFDTSAHSYGQPGSTYESSYEAARNSIDDHMKKQLDEQLSKRGLCCFPSLTTKKITIQPLLSDEVSVLSTNNSDAFLQKLAHIDQRERERQEKQQEVAKSEEIVLLEKQGRCSQKMRNNTMGNLVQVSQSVGQNMTDISNIGVSVPKLVTNLTQNILPPRKERGSSLPPTANALSRPPRGLKPPRKIEYDRLSDSELKKRAQTPPKLTQRAYDLKTGSLKRGDFCPRRDFSPGKTYMEMKETMAFKHKDYGSIPRPTFSKPDFTSTRNYQRLEDAPPPLRKTSPAETSLKRSLLPSVTRKPAVVVKNSRDSLNSASSGSNNSNHSATNSRSSPVHISAGPESPYHPLHYHAKTPPKYMALGARAMTSPSKPPQPLMHHPQPPTASLPPKPAERRAGSVTRGENRYRIQF